MKSYMASACNLECSYTYSFVWDTSPSQVTLPTVLVGPYLTLLRCCKSLMHDCDILLAYMYLLYIILAGYPASLGRKGVRKGGEGGRGGRGGRGGEGGRGGREGWEGGREGGEGGREGGRGERE